jgi:processive 1,2-diacylglycerol beta-glucosyltransferase
MSLAAATNRKRSVDFRSRVSSADASPVLLLTIANGAGHTRAAEAIADAWRALDKNIPARVVDVSDLMSPLARFTHVSAYLWLVKNAPWMWDKIDRYQKRQPQTSPAWFYRRECRRLFEFVRSIRPRALVATEVGCCEIAALIKRDLTLDVPLVAVNIDYEADRAWAQPEVDLHTVMTDEFADLYAMNGAKRDRVVVWGSPLSQDFATRRDAASGRPTVCEWLRLDEKRPIVLMSGGGEGLGQIEASLRRLLADADAKTQFVILAGHNERLRDRCERIVTRGNAADRVRVLAWIDDLPMPLLMRSCDLLVSKLGNTFDEAIASELPIVALDPPPGSERVQYELLERWGTGRAVRSVDELVESVRVLLSNDSERERMRENCRRHQRRGNAANKIATWIAGNIQGCDAI